MTSDAIGALSGLLMAFEAQTEEGAKRQFNINKALQIAQAITNTAQGIMAQLAVPQDALTGANFVKAGIVAATGAAQVATIAQTQFQGGSSGGSFGSIPTPSAQSSPAQFNVVGQNGINQLAASLNSRPLKAYVVGSEVTSQQELDRKKVNNISFP